MANLHTADEDYYITSEYLLQLANCASELFESSEAPLLGYYSNGRVGEGVFYPQSTVLTLLVLKKVKKTSILFVLTIKIFSKD